jgi:ankyrin repeat protein
MYYSATAAAVVNAFLIFTIIPFSSFAVVLSSQSPQQCILLSSDPMSECDVLHQKVDENGRSTLHASIFRGSTKLARHIINQNNVQLASSGTISEKHVRGSTLLIAACEKERLHTLFAEIAKLYLRFGYIPRPKHMPDTSSEYFQSTPMLYDSLMELSISNGYLTSITTLSDADTSEITLIKGLANQLNKTVVELPKMLLNEGINVNEKDHRGRTALHEAVQSFSLPLVEMLLKQGGMANVVDKDGMTPLQLARNLGLIEIESLLIKFGATNNNRLSSESNHISINGDGKLQLPSPSNMEDILPLLGKRCDFNRLKRPSWKQFRNKYIRHFSKPIIIVDGFRYYKKRKRKKKKKRKLKKYTVPSIWKKSTLMKKNIGKTFVMVGELPYGELTSPDSYSARIPLKRFLKRYMSTRQQYKIEDGNNLNKQEDGEDEAISKAYMFDPDILKSTHLGRVLLKPFNFVRNGYMGIKDPHFYGAVTDTQMVIGPMGSGAPGIFQIFFFYCSINPLIVCF